MAAKKRGLGRGLDALLGSANRDAGDPVGRETGHHQQLDEIPVEWIHPGEFQPRTEFDEESLNDLAASIKAQGVMQPIVLREKAEHRYEIIAGERRWRAAQLAELEKIPAVIKAVDDESVLAMSLIENIQREDLGPIEEAQALQRLISEFDLTHQQVADAVGRSRTAVTNMLRLMNLSPVVIKLLMAGDIEMGHARALLALADQQQQQAARTIAARQLNVRQAEALVRKMLAPAKTPNKTVDSDTRRLEQVLSTQIGQPVTIKHSKKGHGKITISYNSLDELDGILGKIGDTTDL